MRAGPALKVSATTYVAFSRCPAQAQARFDEKAYPDESRDSFRGALVHRLIARHLRSGPIEDVEQAARMEIGAALNGKMVGLGVNRPSLLDPIIAEASDLYRRFCLYPMDGFEDAEFAVDHELEGAVTLVGKIDGVFTEGRTKVLRDWKTGVLGQPFDQLLFYALLWLLARGELARVEAISLQTGERDILEPTAADLQAVANRLGMLVNEIRSVWVGETTSQKVAGPWCQYCPVLAGCAEGQATSTMLAAGYRARQ